MPQIHSPYSSQLDLTVAALPTINIAKGCALGQEGPLTMTLIFNDENKQEHTLPRSSTCMHAHTHTPSVCCGSSLHKHIGACKKTTASLGFVQILRCTHRSTPLHIWRAESHFNFMNKTAQK